ncbi:MAG: GNAT family N-acetyltransferase [Anaerolineaceae bacterium]|nr:GNAT family N-acetyltransferase [Anaerolineaceae bacterium]
MPFLFDLWHTPEVMKYADEFPKLRGWSKTEKPEVAWNHYQTRRADLGKGYVQFILRTADDTRIGESFFAPLEEGYTFGKWRKPDGLVCLLGDIKLMPSFWRQGLGSEGMRLVVDWLFDHTPASLLIVPPHRKNPAAERVYEKAGFVLFPGMKSWYGHKVMELDRERYGARLSG